MIRLFIGLVVGQPLLKTITNPSWVAKTQSQINFCSLLHGASDLGKIASKIKYIWQRRSKL